MFSAWHSTAHTRSETLLTELGRFFSCNRYMRMCFTSLNPLMVLHLLVCINSELVVDSEKFLKNTVYMLYIYLAQIMKINTIITCVHFRYDNLINKTLL